MARSPRPPNASGAGYREWNDGAALFLPGPPPPVGRWRGVARHRAHRIGERTLVASIAAAVNWIEERAGEPGGQTPGRGGGTARADAEIHHGPPGAARGCAVGGSPPRRRAQPEGSHPPVVGRKPGARWRLPRPHVNHRPPTGAFSAPKSPPPVDRFRRGVGSASGGPGGGAGIATGPMARSPYSTPRRRTPTWNCSGSGTRRADIGAPPARSRGRRPPSASPPSRPVAPPAPAAGSDSVSGRAHPAPARRAPGRENSVFAKRTALDRRDCGATPGKTAPSMGREDSPNDPQIPPFPPPARPVAPSAAAPPRLGLAHRPLRPLPLPALGAEEATLAPRPRWRANGHPTPNCYSHLAWPRGVVYSPEAAPAGPVPGRLTHRGHPSRR